MVIEDTVAGGGDKIPGAGNGSIKHITTRKLNNTHERVLTIIYK